MFDRPVVDLGAIADRSDPSKFVTIEPPMIGTFRWASTRMLVFTPDSGLAGSTKFSVTLHDLTAVDGTGLAAPFVTTFETPTVVCRLVRTSPTWNRGASPATMAIDCDQPVDWNDVAAHASVRFRANKLVTKLYTPTAPDLVAMRNADPTGAQRLEADLARLADDKRALGATQIRFNHDAPCQSDSVKVCHWFVVGSMVPADATAVLDFQPGIVSLSGPLPSVAHKGGEAPTVKTLLVDLPSCIRRCNPESTAVIGVRGGAFTAASLIGHMRVRDGRGRTIEYHWPKRYPEPLRLQWAGLRPNGSYTVEVDPEAATEDGRPLGYRSIVTFTLGRRPNYAWLGTGERVAELGVAAGPAVYTRNVLETAQVRHRLGDDEMLTAIRAYGRGTLDPGKWKADTIALVQSRDADHRQRIDLGELPKAKQGGVYVVAVRSTKVVGGSTYADSRPVPAVVAAKKVPARAWTSTLLQRTNLGVTLKQSPVNVLVSVTNLADAKPVKGAKVQLFAKGDKAYWTGRTDAKGLVFAPANPTAKCARCNLIAIVKNDGHMAYAQSQWRNDYDDTYFDTLANDGTNGDNESTTDTLPKPLLDVRPGESIEGSMFADRGVYNLGDEVHLKGVLRLQTPEKLDLLPIAVTSVPVKVVDDRGAMIVQKKVPLSKTGAFDLVYRIPSSGIQGNYDATVVGTNVSTSALVTSFRRPNFAVDVATGRSEYIQGDTFEGNTDGRYLFGAPMNGRDVTWYLNSEGTEFDPTALLAPGARQKADLAGFSWDYVCVDNSDCPGSYDQLSTADSKLDDTGHLTATFVTPVKTSRHRVLRLNFEAKVTDVDRQTISNRTSALLHPGDRYVGVRVADEFGAAGQPIVADFITLDPKGAVVSGTPLALSLIRWDWVFAKRKDSNEDTTDVGHYQSTVVATAKLTTGIRPVNSKLTPDKPGYYELRAAGKDGRGNWVESGATVYVTGPGAVSWRNPTDESVKLVPERGSYAVGEHARVLVQSPWPTAEGLLTIERGGVLRAERFAIRNSASTLDIPIQTDDTPNVYVNVTLFKGRTAPPSKTDPSDPGRPQMRTGDVSLSVPPTQKALSVAVEANRAEYRPGDAATASVQVRDATGKGIASEVTMWAVDEGILRLTNYTTPDLLAALYPERGLDVQTADSRMRLRAVTAAEAKGGAPSPSDAAPGGGGGDEASGVDAVRKDFRILAVWKATVPTDATGKASVDFKLPESLTKYRILAVATSGADKFGDGKSELRIAKPFLVRPALPRFMNVGDSAEVGAVLQNTTGKSGTAALALELPAGSPVVIDGPTTQSVPLADKPVEVRFKLTATKVGTMNATFRGALTGAGATLTDALVASVPVSVTRRLETVAAAGVVRDGQPQTEQLKLPTDVYPGLGGLTLATSSSALAGLQNGIDSVVEYPYGCLEQRSSRIRVLLMLNDLRAQFPLPALGKDKDFKPVITRELAKIRDYLTADGGLSYWPASDQADLFLTARVSLLLDDARDIGVKVPEDVADQVLAYLQQRVQSAKENGWFDDKKARGDDVDGIAENRAHILYALARAGRPEVALNGWLFDHRFELSLLEQTQLLRAMLEAGATGDKPASLWREIRNYIRIEADQASVQDTAGRVSGCPCLDYLYAGNVHPTAEVLSLLVRIDPKNELAPRMARWLVAQRKDGAWGNTLEDGYALTALVNYYRASESEVPDITASVALGAKQLLTQQFTGRDLSVVSSQSSLDALAGAGTASTPLTFSAKGIGQIFYAARLRYAPKLASLLALDAGITVEREYRTMTGSQGVTTFAAGDLVRVRLRITTAQRRENVAVEDPLPAGFEAINAQLASSSANELGAAATADVNQNQAGVPSAYEAGVNHVELRDDRVLLFAQSFEPGTFVYSYLVRATSPGSFVVPPTQAEEMYRPEIFGRTASAQVVVTPPTG